MTTLHVTIKQPLGVICGVTPLHSVIVKNSTCRDILVWYLQFRGKTHCY